ncbi:PREDICTED: uncharacterized protein LOC104587995 [Nelumbo nucifera]|uniref:Uncharacterized protein LOC104587995 n=1 Tax=Nelumbo nucifera TaxID=4432 RepID=A0A1U7ZA92_NELNU|nr:PREDICTED: uncharacterized protein LOC104587995 [Nelumbo nucifera]
MREEGQVAEDPEPTIRHEEVSAASPVGTEVSGDAGTRAPSEPETPIVEVGGPGVLEYQLGDEGVEPKVIFPSEELTYEEELTQIRQEQGEYCDKHDIPPLHYAAVDLVQVQGHLKGE